MDGGDPVLQPALLRNALTGMLRFGARSTRREFIHYVLAAVLFSLAIGLPLMIALEYQHYAVAQDALQVLYFLPLPALLSRRLHDQNRSAAYLLLMAPGVALWIARKAITLTQPLAVRVAFDGWTWPLDAATGIASLVLIVLILLPGTAGPNRFGPDPRTEK